jgi:hypothetical protein
MSGRPSAFSSQIALTLTRATAMPKRVRSWADNSARRSPLLWVAMHRLRSESTESRQASVFKSDDRRAWCYPGVKQLAHYVRSQGLTFPEWLRVRFYHPMVNREWRGSPEPSRDPNLFPDHPLGQRVDEGTRTPDHQGHNLVLYPTELHPP